MCDVWSWEFSSAALCYARLRIVIAITGASGIIYTQRLLDNIDTTQHEVHLVLTNYAHQLIKDETPDGLRVPPGVKSHGRVGAGAHHASSVSRTRRISATSR